MESKGALLIGFFFFTLMPILSAQAGRYDRTRFTCKSTDPTGSLLNIREYPSFEAQIIGTLASEQWVYIWGYDLDRPHNGYVPIALEGLSGNTDPARRTDPNYVGFVWKNYITCEILN